MISYIGLVPLLTLVKDWTPTRLPSFPVLGGYLGHPLGSPLVPHGSVDRILDGILGVVALPFLPPDFLQAGADRGVKRGSGVEPDDAVLEGEVYIAALEDVVHVAVISGLPLLALDLSERHERAYTTGHRSVQAGSL
jgi:hypothetical protein